MQNTSTQNCETGARRVQSVCRALDILELLARSETGLPLAEIARSMRLKRPTVHNILKTLLARGYAEQEHKTSRYRLGPEAVVLARGYSRAAEVLNAARHELASLAERTGESTALGIWEGMGGSGNLVFLASHDSPRELAARSSLGPWTAHLTASGLVLLAQLEDREIDVYVRRMKASGAPPPVGGWTDFMDALKDVREKELALLVKPEGVTAAAAPIRLADGTAAAIGASGPSVRLHGGALAELERQVRSSATAISEKLGWKPV
ncbi:MAG TPA: IclR family transcriptional regulator [Planctomycetes bacterium]|nr:IclR family transcriptional regulator [Planctomycetota bacterium]